MPDSISEYTLNNVNEKINCNFPDAVMGCSKH